MPRVKPLASLSLPFRLARSERRIVDLPDLTQPAERPAGLFLSGPTKSPARSIITKVRSLDACTRLSRRRMDQEKRGGSARSKRDRRDFWSKTASICRR